MPRNASLGLHLRGRLGWNVFDIQFDGFGSRRKRDGAFSGNDESTLNTASTAAARTKMTLYLGWEFPKGFSFEHVAYRNALYQKA